MYFIKFNLVKFHEIPKRHFWGNKALKRIRTPIQNHYSILLRGIFSLKKIHFAFLSLNHVRTLKMAICTWQCKKKKKIFSSSLETFLFSNNKIIELISLWGLEMFWRKIEKTCLGSKLPNLCLRKKCGFE